METFNLYREAKDQYEKLIHKKLPEKFRELKKE